MRISDWSSDVCSSDLSVTRSNWGEIGADARRFAAAMVKLGMQKGDRIATLAMNHGHHLVSWYGTAGMGGVLHTVNPRLFDEQMVYIVNHAEDRVLLFDAMFLPIVERPRPQLPPVQRQEESGGGKEGTRKGNDR